MIYIEVIVSTTITQRIRTAIILRGNRQAEDVDAKLLSSRESQGRVAKFSSGWYIDVLCCCASPV